MISIQNPCPVCSNKRFAELIDFGEVPQSGILLFSPSEHFPMIRLAFEYCLACAFIRQRPWDQSSWDYRKVNRPTRGQMPVYVNEVIDFFNQSQSKDSDLVLEIGGNDGAFMDQLAIAGLKCRLIIEPSLSLAEVARKKGHPVENVYFNLIEAERLRKRYGPAKVVFCRHVLEHVPDPEDFFRALRLMTAVEGMVFLETPDVYGITQRLLGHELWDEHLSFYSLDHLSRLTKRFGFDIYWKAVRPHRGGFNILLWARPGELREAASINTAEKDLALCRSFKERWLKFSLKIRQDACHWKRPVACLGASHPQSNFVVFSGLGDRIDFLVDDDPEKLNSFVPLPNLTPVLSTEQLLDGHPLGTLLLTAFGCQDWIDKVQKPLVRRGVRLIDPYLFLA
ncbi:MAG: class I SAM-dependent methyltransferase [Deltaproteobacteria bacterium]|nr:class I SAM-dependent methyltransferase [Deltaproteobacteria bacterium]